MIPNLTKNLYEAVEKMTKIGKSLRMQSRNRRIENARVVKKILSEFTTSYFTNGRIVRETGWSPQCVGVALRFLHDQGYIEKVSNHVWKKNSSID